jgi:ATP-dependent DNA helicase UvrD/PcrA
MFPVLLHPDLYRRLRQSARGERARVGRTLCRLRDGLWGGGTRVKRLRGVGRPVYEARADSGDRLLFTVARAASPDDPGRTVSHLQVWDWVEHDDAVRVARRNRAPEAEFLELPALEQFEIDEPPPHPEVHFDEIPAEAGAEPLLQFLLPPDGFAAPAGEDSPGGVRWFRLDAAVLADEEEFQRLLDTGGEELEIKLTREQYAVLGAPGPVLLAGSAGCGKTTIAVHRLAHLAGTGGTAGSRLYLSYSAALVDYARALWRDLALARGDDPDRDPPDFFTFGDLYRSLAPHDFREHQARPMTEALFRKWFRKAGRSLDPGLVWEELRSILKGACLAPGQPMLDEEAYFELGRKRAPLFVAERPEIYRIAQRYQAWLAAEGRSDRIDLCRRALRELRHGRARRYEVVVCDEVQDLTELEVAFVLSLSAHPDLGGVLLAGDTQQIVNPSGFRWAEVRRLAARLGRLKAVPEVLRLRRNLRSVRPLVELANALLLLRRDLFGRSEGDEPEEAAVEGPVPIAVLAAEEEVLAAVADFGPRCAVLALDDAEVGRLRGRLGTARVFHVREAKGLEFDAVVLWKLLAPDRDLVERYGRGDPRLVREPRFEHLLRHLYVAATRARRHLAVYEGEGPELHPFWRQERLRGRIEEETVDALSRLFRPTASPADWAREGDYFRDRGHPLQAAECYRRAGLGEREDEARAVGAEAVEDWAAALAHWTRLGVPAREAPLLERLGRLEEALARYRDAGLAGATRVCELRLLESRGTWAQAAAGWEELGRHAAAARCWAEAGEERRALAAGARSAEAEGEWARAGAAWFELGDHQAAARCFRAAGDRERAALALAHRYEAAARWGRAAAAYRRAGRAEAAERCRARAQEGAGRPDLAAGAWERLGEVERAIELYAQADRWPEVARLEPVLPEERRRLLPRVQRLLADGDWEAAGALARSRMEALKPFVPVVPWFIAVEAEHLARQEFCALETLEQRCRALAAEHEGAWSRAARLWSLAGDAEQAARARRRRIEGVRDPARRKRAKATAEQVEKPRRPRRPARGAADTSEGET